MSTSPNIIKWLLERNSVQAQFFKATSLERLRYLALHPTLIIALKCMDGRLDVSVMTKTPPGIIQPFRNLGGKFDLGWPYFGSLLEASVMSAINGGRGCIILVTYHWSKGKPERGCKGFDFDLEGAKEFTRRLKEDLETVFGSRQAVYPIQVGIETDEDALVFHGEGDTILDLGQESKLTDDELRQRLHEMYPDMSSVMIADLLPLLRGNCERVSTIRQSEREPLELVHGERVLAFGRGFSWLHTPNRALIVGPYSLDLVTPLVTAGKLLLQNLQEGRIPTEDGVALLVSSVYHSLIGPDKQRATFKSIRLHQFALDVLKREVPELVPHLSSLVGVINPQTQRFEPLD